GQLRQRADQGGAGLGAVAFPQLPTVGREEQRPVHGRQVAGERAVGDIPHEVSIVVVLAVCSRVEVLDEGGAGGGAFALPQLGAGRTVVGPEEESAVHVRERPDARASAAGVYVLDQDSAGLRAVTLPQLRPVRAIIGGEEQRPVHVRQVVGGR